MRTRERLLVEIEEHCRLTGMSERTFGYVTTEDGRFVERLRASNPTLKLIERAEAYLDAAQQQRASASSQEDCAA